MKISSLIYTITIFLALALGSTSSAVADESGLMNVSINTSNHYTPNVLKEVSGLKEYWGKRVDEKGNPKLSRVSLLKTRGGRSDYGHLPFARLPDVSPSFTLEVAENFARLQGRTLERHIVHRMPHTRVIHSVDAVLCPQKGCQ